MPTYVYETIPQDERDEPRRFERWQSMKDAPLTTDPDTGLPVRRVITGGLEMPRAPADPKAAPARRHGDSCSCCNPVRKK